MRTSGYFTAEQRDRLRRYLARNVDVSSVDLAADLYLDLQTVIAWRAWNTREMRSQFNKALRSK